LFGDIEISFPNDEVERQNKQIIGLEFGGGTLKRLKADTINGKSDISRDMLFGGIKLGAEDIGLRLFLSYRPTLIDDNYIHNFGLELDSLIPMGAKFNFFYGLNAGAILYKIVDDNLSTDFNKDSSIYYGIETGLIFKASKKFEFELGGRLVVTNFNNEIADKTYIFDQIISWYLALNYKY
jgi:hypothetical protein